MSFFHQRSAMRLASHFRKLNYLTKFNFKKNIQSTVDPIEVPARFLLVSARCYQQLNIVPGKYMHENALSVIQSIEKDKIRIQKMNFAQRESYFDERWSLMQKDKSLRCGSVARFLHLKLDCGMDISYETVLGELKHLNIRPDSHLFSVFIRKSCENADMEQTSVYLKAMHQAGVMPNDYIFAKILHGYVKCGLPDEVATTQDVMSKLNYWPSFLATENLLTAYADLGDGDSVLELIKEADTKGNILPTRLISDLYARLAVTSNFDSSDSVASELLALIKLRPEGFDDFRIGLPLATLMTAGQTDAALELLKACKPHKFSNWFLGALPDFLSKGSAAPEVLNKFWFHSDCLYRLMELARFMTLDSLIFTLKAAPRIRQESLWHLTNFAAVRTIRQKDVEGAVALGHTAYYLKPHLYYMVVVPRLLALGLKPEEILTKCDSPKMKSAAAFGMILSEICAFSAFENEAKSDRSPSLDLARQRLDQFNSDNLFPFSEYLSINSNSTLLLLRGAVYHSQQPAADTLDNSKLNSWMDLLMGMLAPERRSIIAGSLLRDCLDIAIKRPTAKSGDESSIQSPSQDAGVASGSRFVLLNSEARKNLAIHFSEYLAAKKIPVTHLGTIERSLRTHGLPKPALLSINTSSEGSVTERLSHMIQSGDIQEAINEIRAMQKANTRDASPLGLVTRVRFDLLDKALAYGAPSSAAEPTLETSASEAAYSPHDLEELMWALMNVVGLRKPGQSISKIAECYLHASNFSGLVAFLRRVSEEAPGNINVMSDQLITQMLRQNATETKQLIDELLSKGSLSLASVMAIAYNLHCAESQSQTQPQVSTFRLGISTLEKRLEGLNQLRKVRIVHSTVEDLCRNRHLLTAYAVRDWGTQLNLTLLPQTTSVLVSASLFLDSRPPIPADFIQPSRITLWGSPDLSFLPKVNDAVTQFSEGTTKEIAALVSGHDLSVYNPKGSRSQRRNTFIFWSLFGQALQTPGSKFVSSMAWRRIASEIIENASENGTEAVLSWTSCLIDRHRIASLAMAGLASPKSNDAFRGLLQKQPNIYYDLAANNLLLNDLNSDQQILVNSSFDQCGQAGLLRLAQALTAGQVLEAREAIGAMGNNYEPHLTGLLNSQPSLLTSVLAAVEDKGLDQIISLINKALQMTQTRRTPMKEILNLLFTAARPNCLQSESPNIGCLSERLSLENQAYLRALFRFRDAPANLIQRFATGSYYFNSLEDLDKAKSGLSQTISKAIHERKVNELTDTLLSIKESNPNAYVSAAKSIVYSQVVVNGASTLIPLLLSTCSLHDGDLLEAVTNASTPFLYNNMPVSLHALADLFRKRDVDPVCLEAITYHKLGDFTVPAANPRGPTSFTAITENHGKPTEPTTDDPVNLAKESVSYLANVLSGDQVSDEAAMSVIDVVRKLWGPGRVDLILCHLTEKHSIKAIDRIVDNMPLENMERRLPFKVISRIIKHHTCLPEEREANTSQYASWLASLQTASSQTLGLCMNGPHMSTLFSTWPEDTLNDAVNIVNGTSGRLQTILRLQLAASLVHRNLADKATPLIEVSGPIPFNYLAGSPQHPLSSSAFLASIEYLKLTDEAHLNSFVDASLRNAAIAARSQSSEAAIKLVDTAANVAQMKLIDLCQPSTLRLLRELKKDDPEFQSCLSDEPTPGNCF